jgi:hypothetical protein
VETSGVEQERLVLTGVSHRIPIDPLWERLADAGVAREDVQFIWSSTNGLFVHTSDGATRYVSIGLQDTERPTAGKPFALPKVMGRVISASSTAGFSVIETDFDLWALIDGQVAGLLHEEAISVRTYPVSRWFTRVVSSTLADALMLVAVIGEPYSARSTTD